MKRNSFLAAIAALVIGMASITFVTPALADSTRAAQKTALSKVNSGYLADILLDGMKLPFGTQLTSAYTHPQSDTTLADTALSVTVVAGKSYRLVLDAYVTANASGGVKIDFAGGSATATAFEGNCDLYAGTTFSASTRQTALNTGAGASAELTNIRCTAYLTVNAAGTVIIQAAQNASHASNSIVRAGSNLVVFPL